MMKRPDCLPKNAYFCQKCLSHYLQVRSQTKLFIMIAKLVGEQKLDSCTIRMNLQLLIWPILHFAFWGVLRSMINLNLNLNIADYICCILTFCNLIFFMYNVDPCLVYPTFLSIFQPICINSSQCKLQTLTYA